MIAFAVPILEAKLGDWTNMILNNMLEIIKREPMKAERMPVYMKDLTCKKCLRDMFVFSPGKVMIP